MKNIFQSKTSENTWIKIFGGPGSDFGDSVRQTSDGGYIIAGITQLYIFDDKDAWLIKTDSNGDLVWDKKFGKNGDDGFWCVRETNDDGLILTGFTSSYGQGDRDLWLLKTDNFGNEQWNRTFGGTECDEGWIIQQTNDDGYVITGFTSSFGSGAEDIWIMKTNSTGEEEWNRTFGFQNGKDGGEFVRQTSDGGYILSGWFIQPGRLFSNVCLIKLDSNGNTVFNKIYEGGLTDVGACVTQTPDGGYIIAGITQSPILLDWNAWIIKTDPEGNITWDKKIGGMLGDYAIRIENTLDGKYIITGCTGSIGTRFSLNSIFPRVLLIKMDNDGNIEWKKRSRYVFGLGFSLQQTSDGGYIIGGHTGTHHYARNILLIKTDECGKPLYDF